ncbi:La protein 7 [Paragonimus heterotremus]|uniref:La protein 7 n=1 Tax=Paragonimus heterotremus TaxID=100268 RepID=A0A8J4WG42_9TREM|nr:La protein 7 [Paragonimus heterotremus]
MRQVEFYLSAGNLCRDKFFSREMKKRSDGGIAIELLLQCHRLQTMQVTKDLLIRAVKKSSLIKLSDDGEAVVRTCPLPELSVPREKRTVLVCGIPRWFKEPEPKEDFVLPNSDMRTSSESGVCVHENSSWEMMDWLREVFSEFGEVLYINLPHYHSSGIFRGFAFVEFSNSKDAKAASKAMRPNPEHEIWFVPPISQEMASGVNAVHENAWKPRLAAKTSFCPGDMLARRYVWRTCSRKNKQIQTAFRQLRASGYRAANPCDREYELITLGESSAEARSKYLRESYGEPRREKLRVFRYSTWEFWRSKFYAWLHAWVVRMNKKTEELSLEPLSNLMDTTGGDLTDLVNRDEPSTSVERSAESVPNILANTACADHNVILPKNFVHTTVVLLYWPANLVPATEQFVHSPKESDELFPVCKPHLSLARRIRISVEHHLLSACNLLEEVAHLDPTPSEAILTEVISALGASAVLSTTDYPVFIRMKTKPSACELCRFIEEARASDTQSSASISSVRAHLLFGLTELAYCRALSTSLVGANERRRRAQLSRRLRRKTEQQCQGSHNSDPFINDLSSGQMLTPSSDAQLRHILFDE